MIEVAASDASKNSYSLTQSFPSRFDTFVSDLMDREPCVLMYGHMDKQPPLADQWEEGLGTLLILGPPSHSQCLILAQPSLCWSW